MNCDKSFSEPELRLCVENSGGTDNFVFFFYFNIFHHGQKYFLICCNV